MNYKDYYATLGVEKNATEKDIKKAFRRLANQYHPDKNPGDKASEEKFKEINEANEVLSDPQKRKKYDQLGANWEAYQQGGYDFSQAGGSPFGHGGNGGRTYYFEGDPSEIFGKGGSGFSSFFERFFGGGGGGFRGAGGGEEDLFEAMRGGGRTRQSRAFKGNDWQAEMEISLEEAFAGTTRTFELHGQNLRIKIKPGAAEGQVLRLKGKGAPGASGGAPGDLLLTLRVSPHPLFRREGDNLLLEKQVDLFTAVLGGKVEAPTLSGNVQMNIPKGIAPGSTLRLKGKGMPNYENPERHGDLLVKINVRLPKNLSPEQERLFERLRELEQEKHGVYV
ncbi:MAG: J domain-containing protein [Bacteroidota bacterium]